MAKLTQTYLEQLGRETRECVHWDDDLKGLGVRARSSGRLTWIVQYRTLSGAQRKLTLGTFPTLNVKDARRRARVALGQVSAGADPAQERDTERHRPTFATVAERYLVEHAKLKNKPSTIREAKRLLEKRMAPAWGSRDISRITSGDVAKLHHEMRSTPRSANHMVAVASKIFSLAERWGLRSQNTNPCRGLERYREHPRERYASEQELQRLGEALTAFEKNGGLNHTYAAAVRFLALSGLRLSEALSLRWTDLDTAQSLLVIRDAKVGGRVQVLGAPALGVLTGLVRGGDWVFPGPHPEVAMKPNALEYAWQRIRSKAALDDLRLHDLRHGYGTFAGQTGANAFMIRDALGHKTLAMTGRYVNRDAHPMRALADEVAGRIGSALSRGLSDA